MEGPWKIEGNRLTFNTVMKIERFETCGEERWMILHMKETQGVAMTLPEAMKQAEGYYYDAYSEYLYEQDLAERERIAEEIMLNDNLD